MISGHKYIVLLVLVVLLSATIAQGAQEKYDIDDYNRLSVLSTPEFLCLHRQI